MCFTQVSGDTSRTRASFKEGVAVFSTETLPPYKDCIVLALKMEGGPLIWRKSEAIVSRISRWDEGKLHGWRRSGSAAGRASGFWTGSVCLVKPGILRCTDWCGFSLAAIPCILLYPNRWKVLFLNILVLAHHKVLYIDFFLFIYIYIYMITN